MHDAIMVELATTGNAVTVFGWSQSAIIASLEMQRFTAMGGAAPSASDLNFVLVGNEMNPNGGMLARFPDLTLPTLDLTFYGATPSDTIYPTAIYTLEYDGFADFSRYPLNFISDLNAVAGITFVHTKYLDLTPAQVEGATKLPTSPGYTGVTDYYIIRTENRPLLQPLRAVPVIGDPPYTLIREEPPICQRVRAPHPRQVPAWLPNPLLANLSQTGGSSMLTLPDDRAPTGLPDPGIEALAHTKIASTISTVVADGYAVVLSTADIANSLLANAIGYPIAASVALVTPAAGANSSCWPADPSQHHRIAESRACA